MQPMLPELTQQNSNCQKSKLNQKHIDRVVILPPLDTASEAGSNKDENVRPKGIEQKSVLTSGIRKTECRESEVKDHVFAERVKSKAQPLLGSVGLSHYGPQNKSKLSSALDLKSRTNTRPTFGNRSNKYKRPILRAIGLTKESHSNQTEVQSSQPFNGELSSIETLEKDQSVSAKPNIVTFRPYSDVNSPLNLSPSGCSCSIPKLRYRSRAITLEPSCIVLSRKLADPVTRLRIEAEQLKYKRDHISEKKRKSKMPQDIKKHTDKCLQNNQSYDMIQGLPALRPWLLERYFMEGKGFSRFLAQQSKLSFVHQIASTNSPGPYSTPDLIGSYNNDSNRLPDDLRIGQGNITDKEKRKHLDLEKRPPSRKESKKILPKALGEKERERDIHDRHKEDQLPPPYKQQNYFRPKGLRNNFLSGQQIQPPTTSQKNSSHSEDLVAMGTNWNPPNSQIRNGRSGSMGSVYAQGTTGGPQGTRKTNAKTGIGQSHSLSGIRQRDSEPKYPDPFINAPPSFQQRIAELASLEGDTVRWERARKFSKKKPKGDT